MAKIGIVTCSTSGLDYIEGYKDIKIARTTIMMNGNEYIDGLSIHPQEFYEKLSSSKDIPKTAQPSIGQ